MTSSARYATPERILRVLLCMGIALLALWSLRPAPPVPVLPLAQPVTLLGQVVSFPEQRLSHRQATLELTHYSSPHWYYDWLHIPPPASQTRARVLLRDQRHNSWGYGDRLEITGKLQLPTVLGSFDYRGYLLRYGITHIVRAEEAALVAPAEGNPLLQWAYSLRQWSESRLKRLLPVPHRQLLSGILLGIREDLPPRTEALFRHSTLQHILVVSGYNITVLMVFVSLLFRRLGRRVVFWSSVGVVLFYCLVTGADAPVVRSSIMGLVAGWGISQGRMADMPNVLLLTVLLMAAVTPRILLFDIGFQLSVLATLGIITLLPLWEGVALRGASRLLWDLLGVSLIATLSTLPLQLLQFGVWYPAGLIANVLIEPVVPLVMLLGVVLLLLGPVTPWLGYLLGAGVWSLLELTLHLAQLTSSIPLRVVSPTVGYSVLGLLIVLWGWCLFSPGYERLLHRWRYTEKTEAITYE
ncbi:ComEC/Rec2 family competence protein [Candidatus Peribacteria bacterium]|nr:ComEC/Rec2 family competence protein [Candidatus Peribacteria bacterium]